MNMILFIDLLNYMRLVHTIHASVGHETAAHVNDVVIKHLCGKSFKYDTVCFLDIVFQKFTPCHVSKMCRGEIIQLGSWVPIFVRF